MAKAIGRTVQKTIVASIKEAKPAWSVNVPKQRYRSIADITIKNRKHNVIIKIKTSRVGIFRFSSFDEEQLSAMSRFHMAHRNNLSLIFFYFVEQNVLFGIDVQTLLDISLGTFTFPDIEPHGMVFSNWTKLSGYFDVMLKLKEHPKRRKGKCVHYWLIESRERARRRSGSYMHSMGYCKKCGRVKGSFQNFLVDNKHV